MKKNYTILLLMVFFSLAGLRAQVSQFSYRGYPECYLMMNDSVRVIITPEAGGRVLLYGINGKNMLYENSNLNGKTLSDYLSKQFDPDGGRFDVGPEGETSSIHDTTWIGPYSVESADDHSLKITSMVDKQLGIDISREFMLDSVTSHLKIRQTMTNRSDHETDWFFWGRTLCSIGGKMVVAVNPDSRYDYGWGMYVRNPWHFSYDDPSDPLIEALDTLLTFTASKTGKSGKYGTDADRGWMVYGYNEMLFLKKFEIDLSKTYATDSGQTIIFYTNGSSFVEMEPNSPVAALQPGESYTYDEDWWLFSYPEAATQDFDGTTAASFALEHAQAGINTGSRTSLKSRTDDVYVYPNPASDRVSVHGVAAQSIDLFSMNGQHLLHQDRKTGRGLTLDIRDIPQGLYLIRISFTDGSLPVMRKLVVTK